MPDLNVQGWKLAHIQPVGLKNSKKLADRPLSALQAHHRAFLSPSNMFLMPKQLAGLAEVAQIIEAFRTGSGTALQ